MFMAIVLATVCFVSSMVFAAYDKPLYELENAENLFKDFVKEHNKIYNQREYSERLEIFKENLKDINERNLMFPETIFGLNYFADLKPQELQYYLGFKPSNKTMNKIKIPTMLGPIPEEFDWRNHHAVSHVKNQQKCGSCFIFSAIGNIEGQYAIKHGKCLALSEGQALDCLDCGTCDGGFTAEVMGELVKTAIEKEEDYPFYPRKRECKENSAKGFLKVTGNVLQLDITNEEELAAALTYYGPLSIALSAKDFDHYNGGILEPSKCKGLASDHAVLLVGYGRENGKQYWTIKNSWGEHWGEKGYLRLLAQGSSCNIFDHVVTTTIF